MNGTNNNTSRPAMKGGLNPSRFCVALMKTGECVRIEYTSPEELKPTLEKARLAWINYSLDDLGSKGEEVAVTLGFSKGLVSRLLESADHSDYEDLDTELGLLVPAITVNNLEVNVSPLIVLIREGVILTMAGNMIVRLVRFSRYANTFFRKIAEETTWQDALTLALIRILDENNDRNFDHLREIEGQADELSKDLMDPKTPRTKIGPAIYAMKHALIVYMDALWYTLDVVNNLRYGDAEAISDDTKILQRFAILSSDINQQIQLAEHMSEVVASGLEVLQTIYNNQLQMLNNRLALLATWLAIIGTAILVPNTLATIYGIAPVAEHIVGGQGLSFIYFTLVFSTIISAIAMFVVLKHKGWMPKTGDD